MSPTSRLRRRRGRRTCGARSASVTRRSSSITARPPRSGLRRPRGRPGPPPRCRTCSSWAPRGRRPTPRGAPRGRRGRRPRAPSPPVPPWATSSARPPRPTSGSRCSRTPARTIAWRCPTRSSTTSPPAFRWSSPTCRKLGLARPRARRGRGGPARLTRRTSPAPCARGIGEADATGLRERVAAASAELRWSRERERLGRSTRGARGVDVGLRVTFLTHFFRPRRARPRRGSRRSPAAWPGAGAHVTVHTGFPHYPDGRIKAPYANRPLTRSSALDGLRVVRSAVHAAPNRGFARRMFSHTKLRRRRRRPPAPSRCPPTWSSSTARRCRSEARGSPMRRLKRAPYVLHVGPLPRVGHRDGDAELAAGDRRGAPGRAGRLPGGGGDRLSHRGHLRDLGQPSRVGRARRR